MQPFGRQDVSRDQPIERHDGKRSRTDLIGQRRDRKVNPFALEPLALTVQRNLLPELVEQNRRQKLRPDEAAGRGMEGCRRLRDCFAITACELQAARSEGSDSDAEGMQRQNHISPLLQS
jgi:hypothetical protein